MTLAQAIPDVAAKMLLIFNHQGVSTLYAGDFKLRFWRASVVKWDPQTVEWLKMRIRGVKD